MFFGQVILIPVFTLLVIFSKNEKLRSLIIAFSLLNASVFFASFAFSSEFLFSDLGIGMSHLTLVNSAIYLNHLGLSGWEFFKKSYRGWVEHE